MNLDQLIVDRAATVAQEAARRALEEFTKANGAPPRWLNSKQAASYCGISYHYFCKLRERKKGPPYRRLGKLAIYDRADLDAFMEALAAKGAGR